MSPATPEPAKRWPRSAPCSRTTWTGPCARPRGVREIRLGQLSPNDRGVLLHRLADAVEKRKKILAQIEALDCGKVYAQAEGDVQNFVDTTAVLHRTWRCTSSTAVRWPSPGTRPGPCGSPWGPCGFIFPWNFPILLAGWGIAPALAAGNTVVIKPAEDTPLSTIYLARLAKEVGIPDGVINVVPGLGRGGRGGPGRRIPA